MREVRQVAMHFHLQAAMFRLAALASALHVHTSVSAAGSWSVLSTQPVSQPVSQSVSRSVGQSVSQSVGQSVSRSFGQSVSRSVGEGLHGSGCGGNTAALHKVPMLVCPTALGRLGTCTHLRPPQMHAQPYRVGTGVSRLKSDLHAA